jgi:transketolase
MRSDCIKAIEELALADPKVVVVPCDPGPGFMAELASRYPERLMVEGICEQALVGVSAGLASEGYYPFIIGLAVFSTRRCYEQLLLDFGLNRLSGCVVGAGGGLNYSYLGPTHLAVDDISLMSSIPSAAVLAPGDSNEAAVLVPQAREHQGLSYMRLTETTDPVAETAGNIELGKGRALCKPGRVLFVSCGAATLAVQSALSILRASELSVSAIHLHTIKPIDRELLCQYIAEAKAVVCVEEHRKIGGLSSAVLHLLTAAGIRIPPFTSIGVDDGFPIGNGTYQEMMTHYGITGAALAERAREALRHAEHTS